MIRRALSWVKGEAAFLVLLAVCAAAAWLYVDYRHVRADRDDLAHRVEVICTAAGEEFAATKGAARGIRCKARVAAMVAFKANSDQQTAKLLADAMAAHDARQSTDNQAARAAAEAARSAALRMEAADAEAERRNLVDREWFAAVNGVAGLRAATR
ncbi:MAG TPA: hypothetical protein VFO80_02550 [Sphingomonas sp.]|nr:hypothetical protein [Sphingomonas sp.]